MAWRRMLIGQIVYFAGTKVELIRLTTLNGQLTWRAKVMDVAHPMTDQPFTVAPTELYLLTKENK